MVVLYLDSEIARNLESERSRTLWVTHVEYDIKKSFWSRLEGCSYAHVTPGLPEVKEKCSSSLGPISFLRHP